MNILGHKRAFAVALRPCLLERRREGGDLGIALLQQP